MWKLRSNMQLDLSKRADLGYLKHGGGASILLGRIKSCWCLCRDDAHHCLWPKTCASLMFPRNGILALHVCNCRILKFMWIHWISPKNLHAFNAFRRSCIKFLYGGLQGFGNGEPLYWRKWLAPDGGGVLRKLSTLCRARAQLRISVDAATTWIALCQWSFWTDSAWWGAITSRHSEPRGSAYAHQLGHGSLG